MSTHHEILNTDENINTLRTISQSTLSKKDNLNKSKINNNRSNMHISMNTEGSISTMK